MDSRSGIVVIDKPAGWSSFKAVKTVKRTLRAKRAGHTGTLDPLATGVLPVCINEATKVIRFLSEDEKEYKGTLVLGAETDTFDVTGKVVGTSNVPDMTWNEVQAIFAGFTGVIKQNPPPFAAVKFKGRPLYDWARKGIFIEKEAREVTIKELAIEKLAWPEISFRTVCSKGTYIRSLVNDIGRKIGCGAYLKELRRLRSGPFAIEQAVTPEAIEERSLLPVSDILCYLPSVEVDGAIAKEVQQGRRLVFNKADFLSEGRKGDRPWVRVLSKTGNLLAIYTWRAGSDNLEPVRVFRTL